MRFALAALLAGALMFSGGSTADPVDAPMTTSALHQADSLSRFFAALDRAGAGEVERPVHVVQIGDSHTAGDLITSSLRSRLQNRFGLGGRGAIPPGRPYALYAPRQIEVFERGFSLAMPPPGDPGRRDVGLSGGRALVWSGEAALEMTAEPEAAFSRVVVCATGGPAAGALRLLIDGADHWLDFTVPATRALCREARVAAPARSLRIETVSGSMMLHSVATFADGPGVALSNLGLIGATLNDLAGRDRALIATELSAWAPDLIILAFGTNEGFDPLLEPVRYEALLRAEITRLRDAAPGADLLILGAPDAQRGTPPPTAPRGEGEPCEATLRWKTPPELLLVRDVQRRVAADMGVAFWDWRERMGGDCSAQRLATAFDPLMRTDRVHFNSAGGDWLGRLIFDDLMAAYGARTETGAGER